VVITQVVQCDEMTFGQIENVNVVADSSTILGRVVLHHVSRHPLGTIFQHHRLTISKDE
jgi:hypothetical protein